MSDNRIENLETTLAHQDRQIQDLSDMLVMQGKEIAALKRHIVKTEEKLEAYMGEAKETADLSAAEMAAREKPPHY